MNNSLTLLLSLLFIVYYISILFFSILFRSQRGTLISSLSTAIYKCVWFDHVHKSATKHLLCCNASKLSVLSFNLQRHPVISADSNVTALVPSKDAFRNLSVAEEQFWTDYYRLPYLLQYDRYLFLLNHSEINMTVTFLLQRFLPQRELLQKLCRGMMLRYYVSCKRIYIFGEQVTLTSYLT